MGQPKTFAGKAVQVRSDDGFVEKAEIAVSLIIRNQEHDIRRRLTLFGGSDGGANGDPDHNQVGQAEEEKGGVHRMKERRIETTKDVRQPGHLSAEKAILPACV